MSSSVLSFCRHLLSLSGKEHLGYGGVAACAGRGSPRGFISKAGCLEWPCDWLELIPIVGATFYSAFGKSLCTWATAESSWNVKAHGDAREGKFGKSLCTWATAESSWNVMAHGDAREGKFGKSLCTWATAESSWNVMAHGDAREGKFGKSLYTYKRCLKWCPRASVQAWTRLILFVFTVQLDFAVA